MALMLIVEEENRRNLRRDRVFLDRTNPLDSFTDEQLRRRFRLPRHLLLEVIYLIKDDLEAPTRRSHPIPASLQCLCALRFFASGQMQFDSADLGGLSQPTVSRIVKGVATLLARKSKELIKFSETLESQRRIKEGFFDGERSRIPNVIGLIDGSLIGIKTPSQDEETFVSRKGGHAINVQGICDHELKFLNLVIKWPGSTHDAFIWNNCSVRRKFEQGTIDGGTLLGDSAYPLRPWLMTPIRTPTNAAEETFNMHHRRMRQKIENCFGKWKIRWLCLHKYGGLLRVKLETSVNIIAATALLHNICEAHHVPMPEDAPPNDQDNPDEDVNPQHHYLADNQDGRNTRNRIVQEYFT